MALRRTEAATHAAVNAIAQLMNGGTLRIYTGSIPGTGDAPATGTLLATLGFGMPAFPSASDGQAAANAITSGVAVATGTAGYFRALNSAGLPVMDGEINTVNTPLTIPSLGIQAGTTVRATSFVLGTPTPAFVYSAHSSYRAKRATFSGTGTVANPAPPPVSGFVIVGYGKDTVGGTNVVHASSLAQLRSLGAVNGNHVKLVGSVGQVWDANGADILISGNNVTIDNSEAGVVFKGGAYSPRGSHQLHRYIKARVGDQSGNGADLDAITINANGNGTMTDLVFDHCEAMWGPDVLVACLTGQGNAITDVTFQYCIFAEGLYLSSQPESTTTSNGHNLALNFTSLDKSASGTGPQRITVFGCLFQSTESRNPQVRLAGPIDIAACALYNHSRCPYGDAKGGLNLLHNLYKDGVEPELTEGRTVETLPFRSVAKDGPATANSVYGLNLVAANYTLGQIPAAVRAVTPKVAPFNLPALPSGVAGITNFIVANAGARLPSLDAVTTRVLNQFQNGTATKWTNGDGFPAPNPEW